MSVFLGVRTDDPVPSTAIVAAAGNFTIGGLLIESTSSGITAGVTRTQAGATQLVLQDSRIDVSTAPAAGTVLGDGVRLMTAAPGIDAVVVNNTLNIIMLYPNGSDQINGLGAGVGCPLPPGDVASLECIGTGIWHFEAGVGASGVYDTVLACDIVPAAGTTQGTATALPAVINRLTTGTGGFRLPPAVAGIDILVINHTGAAVQVYGSGSDSVDDAAGATGLAQMNGSLCLFVCAASGNWYSNGIGTGYAGAYPTVSYTNGVTAFGGGGQASATLITTALARITTIVTAGDSVKLPLAVPGMQITVFNANATNSLNVFPNTGDAINVLAANAAYALVAGKTVTFFSTVAGFWHALLSA